jgi:large subunit ribosomal protein L4
MYRAAMRSIFSELLRQGRLMVVPDLPVSDPKTRNLVARLNSLGLDKGIVIADEAGENLILASRNIPNIDVYEVRGLNPVALAGTAKVVVTSGAIKQIEAVLA